MGKMNIKPEYRFWLGVEETQGCWLWKRAINKDGYGQFCAFKKVIRAHRFAYELCKGTIPDGCEIDHLCKVRNCVNPNHLEAVTHHENVLRGDNFMAVQARQTHCKRGHLFDEENTYLVKRQNRAGYSRTCRQCVRDIRHTGKRSETHCRKGHEYKSESTYWSPKGHRCCKICDAIRRSHSNKS